MTFTIKGSAFTASILNSSFCSFTFHSIVPLRPNGHLPQGRRRAGQGSGGVLSVGLVLGYLTLRISDRYRSARAKREALSQATFPNQA